MRRFPAFTTAFVVASSSCTPAQQRPPTSPVSGTVYALLADNQLFALSLSTGKVLNSVSLGAAPVERRGVERIMALAPNHNQLVALVSEGLPGTNSIAFVDIPALHVQATRPVPVPDVTYRGLALGDQSGRIYLFGNRMVGADAGPAHGPPSDAVVTVLNPTGSEVLYNWTVRASAGRNWYVLRGAIAADERQIFVSYHGPDTQGMDIFSIEPSGITRCPSAPDPSLGCIRLHGDFELYHDDGFLVATGGPDILQLNSVGEVQRTLHTGLGNNHLMEFAVSVAAGELYAVGSCGYVPGLSAVDLRSGQDRLLVPLGGAICGERVVLGPDPLLVILDLPVPVPSVSEPGALLLVDRRSGKTQVRADIPSSPIDALVIPT